MKNTPRWTALAALAVAFGAGPAGAQYKAGDNILSLELGAGFPASDLNLSRFGAGNQKVGEAGLAVGGRYIRQIDERFGVGGEIGHYNFGDRAFVMTPGLDGTVGGSMLAVQGLARYLLMPAGTVTPYVIGGLGFNQFSAHLWPTRNPDNVLLDADSTGLLVSAGGGVEGRFGPTQSLIAGAELRWLLATIDSAKFGTSTFNALGLGARIGWRF